MFDVITFGIYHISRSKWSGQVFAIRYPVQKCNPQFNSVNIPVQKIAIIHLKGNSRPTIWGSIIFFLAMQICVRVKLGFLIDKIIPSLWTCHQKMEIVIVIDWSVFQGSVQISQATMSWENIHPYLLKNNRYFEFHTIFIQKQNLSLFDYTPPGSELHDLPVSRNLRKRCRSWQRDILATGYKQRKCQCFGQEYGSK